MALTVKSLIATTLPNGAADAGSTYSPGTGMGAVIKSILFVNTHTGPRGVTGKLFRNTTPPAAATANLCPPAMSIPAGSSISLDTEITLSGADQVKFWADGGNVDCIVSGMERTN